MTFHVEHILAQQHVNDDSIHNLALACPYCNRYKGPNLATVHPDSRELVRLFNPRTDVWADHFEFHGPLMVGRTPVGIATVILLKMNDVERVEMRAELLATGEF
ncbi:MAG: HNH endonuclease [Planctomycetia bacterium]|nr:HNH endonuclease [Planctomycetia bacterium]